MYWVKDTKDIYIISVGLGLISLVNTDNFLFAFFMHTTIFINLNTYTYIYVCVCVFNLCFIFNNLKLDSIPSIGSSPP